MMHYFDKLIRDYRAAKSERDKVLAEISIAAYVLAHIDSGGWLTFHNPKQRYTSPLSPTRLKLLKEIVESFDAGSPIPSRSLSGHQWPAARWLKLNGFIRDSEPIMMTGPDNWRVNLIPTEPGRAVLK